MPPILQHTLDKILAAIADSKDTLQKQISTIAVEMGLLGADHKKLVDKVGATEGAIAELQPA